ncbi:glutamyl-tRNA reductase [Paraglaciecola aquimarina]|uniref:Glutamyl-tRNA reductase n=1 Tax=Paraglaciecola aquimarina TaxID=1235557 RepID=A0ABU3SZW0_9ALTE|nr:glutamyl-tRNA reductase [Paraglaciecola aquimarina]MDU0355552.1 glutamyl-tRNA reductase [Paraglaciecola aquimarina]
MTLIAFGINHKTASVELREKIAFSADTLVDALASLKSITGANESVIVSTCNRTEIYAQIAQEQAADITQWLADFHGIAADELKNNSYMHQEQQAAEHIMRVACGLDSLMLGEPQILGQVKQAFTDAKNSGVIGSDFERLFQHTFSVAKRVRSETEIGANAVSVAYASVQLAKHIFSSLEKSRVLLIGAGDTIELVAKHLSEQGVKSLTVANRTLARAQAIAEPLGGDVLTLAQIPSHLKNADIVISSTASQLPILGKGLVQSALKERKHKPMFLVDLAVPRDVEAEVAELDDAYLYTVDDLQQIVEKNLASRQDAALLANEMVEQQVQQFVQWQQGKSSIDVLKNFRDQSEEQRDSLVNRAINQLADGKQADKVLIELANKLTNSLIHAPTKALKKAANEQDSQSLAILKDALGLKNLDN